MDKKDCWDKLSIFYCMLSAMVAISATVFAYYAIRQTADLWNKQEYSKRPIITAYNSKVKTLNDSVIMIISIKNESLNPLTDLSCKYSIIEETPKGYYCTPSAKVAHSG